MEQQRINELVAWMERHEKTFFYARKIRDDIDAVRQRRNSLTENFDTIPAENWLKEYDSITHKEVGITSKIKRFFRMEYPQGSSFESSLKGADYLTHVWKFQDFVSGVYGIKSKLA